MKEKKPELPDDNLIKHLKKNSIIKETEYLEKSIIWTESVPISTEVPMINVALSGDLKGGITSGSTVLAGPSKNFKTGFALFLAKTFLDKHQDGVLLFYDSEFGTPRSYFSAMGIPENRVLHSPLLSVEECRNDMVSQLDSLPDGAKLIIVIDSIGNAASLKEVEDALDNKNVADMTRAKAIKSLFRMIIPRLAIKNVPLIAVSHVYKELGMYPKDVLSGGTGAYYGGNNIWFIGRSQEKDDSGINGFTFNIRVEKSRFLKEGVRIPIKILFDGGMYKYSGLYDLATEAGIITSPGKGWYNYPRSETNVRKSTIEEDSSFFEELIVNPAFQTFVKNKYSLGMNKLMGSFLVNEEDEGSVDVEQ